MHMAEFVINSYFLIKTSKLILIAYPPPAHEIAHVVE